MVVLEVSTLGDPFRIFFRQHRMESVKKGNVRNQKLEIRNEESEIMCGRMVFGRNDSSRVHFHTFHYLTMIILHSCSVSLRPPTHTGATLI